MRRRALAVATLLASLMLILTACGGEKKKAEVKYYDKDFYTALSKGLEARWDLTDKTDGKEEDLTKSDYEAWIKAEQKSISGYKNKKYKDSKLQELVVKYTNDLKEQKKALSYWGSDDSTEKWNSAYDERTKTINELNKLHKIKVSAKYKEDLAELLGNAKSVNDKEAQQNAIDQLTKSIKFTQSSNEDGWITYEAIVENTTKYDISDYYANVKLIDEQGVAVETQSIDATDWSSKSKSKFSFETDQKFSKYEITVDYFEIK